MPRQKIAGKRRTGALTDEQELELIIGPGRASAFANDEARRAAWREHGMTVRALLGAGVKPWAEEVYS